MFSELRRFGAGATLWLVCAGATPASGQGSSDSAAVAAVVRQFHGALAAGDSASAANLLAADAIILESGEEESRAAYVGHHLREDIDFARAVRSESGPIRVSTRGDVAWASGISSTQGDFNGRAVNSVAAELMILSRQPVGGGKRTVWKIRAVHWSSHRRTK